jgi:transcriptional regulator with GAF, ATPase, and Fis domain
MRTEVHASSGLDAALKENERALILQMLESVGWVIGGRNGAAARLGLKRTTLLARMNKLGITRPGVSFSRRDIQQVTSPSSI